MLKRLQYKYCRCTTRGLDMYYTIDTKHTQHTAHQSFIKKMGQLITNSKSNQQAALSFLEETQIFALWTIQDVRELYKRFR